MKRRYLDIASAKFAFCAAGLALSAAHALDGRVVDAARIPLAGVKVTWSLSGQSALTGADGRFQVGTAAGVAPRHSAERPAGPFRTIRADGRRADPATPWSPRFSFRKASPPAPAPLAKSAGQTQLTAERPGFATAKVLIPDNASSLPDIILAPGTFVSSVTGQPKALPIYVAPRVQFEGGTSTDLPDVYHEGERVDPTADFYPPSSRYVPDAQSRTLHAGVIWSLTTLPGIPATIRPHTSVPDTLGKAEVSPFRADIEGQFHATIMEDYAYFEVSGIKSISPMPYGDTVSLLFRNPAGASGYATMKWLQFAGPVRMADTHNSRGNGLSTHIYASHRGLLPPLDTCGRLSGRIDWKGPGDRPELWIGMLGTDLFAKVDADGAFLTTDLPPGILPLAVVAVEEAAARGKGGDGKVTSRTFYHLEGLAVSPGQTTSVEPLELTGP